MSCTLTVLREARSLLNGLRLSRELDSPEYMRLACRVEKETVQILVLAASAEKLAKGQR